jgi:hypothetical protein
MKAALVSFVEMQTFLGILGQGLGAGLVGLVVFVVAGLALGSKEMFAVRDAVKYRLFKIKRPIIIDEEGPK